MVEKILRHQIQNYITVWRVNPFFIWARPVENRSIKWKWKKKLEWGFSLVRFAHSSISPFKLLSFSLYGPVLNRSRPIKRINTPDLDQISYLMSYYPNNYKNNSRRFHFELFQFSFAVIQAKKLLTKTIYKIRMIIFIFKIYIKSIAR
jgi:hypothetical protein